MTETNPNNSILIIGDLGALSAFLGQAQEEVDVRGDDIAVIGISLFDANVTREQVIKTAKAYRAMRVLVLVSQENEADELKYLFDTILDCDESLSLTVKKDRNGIFSQPVSISDVFTYAASQRD